MPKDWPVEIRNGDCVVKIYRTTTTVRGDSYPTFTLSYFANGMRQRRQLADFGKAKNEAERIAEQKAQGALGSAALSAADRVALEEALVHLAKIEGTGRATVSRLIEIVRDHADARASLPPGTTLAEAALYFAQRHPANAPRRTILEIKTEFIADRKSAGCSAIHLRDLEVRLGQFCRAFAVNATALTAPMVQKFITGLKREHGDKPMSARSKENMLRCVVSMFNFARRMKYIPAELALELSEIQTPKKQHTPIGIYNSSEIRKILAAADAEIIPSLVIAAFAGLRLAEVARLDWREVKLGERILVVEAQNSKTAARRIVPLHKNLVTWLAPHAKPFGRVNPCAEEESSVGNALGDRFERAAARAGVKWKRNGFRHSYVSHRVATLKDVPAVALECGNSPAVIFSNYRALATEKEGKAWFAVTPPQTGKNIVPIAKSV